MNRRAFSLIETIIASVTLALALTMLVVLIQQYLRVTRQAQGSQQRVAPRQALAELAEETRLALAIAQPAAGQADRLVFQRVRPTAAAVIGPDPWPASRQMTVTYQLQSNELWRTWEWPGQPAQREMVASQLTTFQVQRLSPKEVRIQLGDHQEVARLWRD